MCVANSTLQIILEQKFTEPECGAIMRKVMTDNIRDMLQGPVLLVPNAHLWQVSCLACLRRV
jgi:hypothetical protein